MDSYKLQRAKNRLKFLSQIEIEDSVAECYKRIRELGKVSKKTDMCIIDDVELKDIPLAPLPKACAKQPYLTKPSVPCQPACIPTPYGYTPPACINEPNKKENNMGYEIETSQRQHLQMRLRDVRDTQASALRNKFNMDPVRSPKTLDELTEALAKGNFTLNKDMFTTDGKYNGWGNTKDAIIWTNPDKPKDQAGYDAAKALLGKAYTAAKDVIIVKSLDDGLKALNDFETATF